MASLCFHSSHTRTTVNKLQFCVWEGCFSKCGPWTNSTSITWEVGRNITCGPYPWAAKSDASQRHIAQCILTSLWKIPASANMWQALLEGSCLSTIFRKIYWTIYSKVASLVFSFLFSYKHTVWGLYPFSKLQLLLTIWIIQVREKEKITYLPIRPWPWPHMCLLNVRTCSWRLQCSHVFHTLYSEKSAQGIPFIHLNKYILKAKTNFSLF